MVRLVELAHVLESGMPMYPGFPPPKFDPWMTREDSRPRYEGKAEFLLGTVKMAGNTGTYLDAPSHRYADGADLASVPLERTACVPGVVLDATVGPDRSVEVPPLGPGLHGRAVLIRTGWSARWGTESYWEPGPFVGRELAGRLVEAAPAIVGVDFWNIDDTSDPVRPAHSELLAAGIPIVEHLCNLDALPEEGFRFYAVPLPIVGGASVPVRAFAEIGG